MNISSSEFLCSSPRVEQCPETKRPEFAFIGRSNVGKSSLINMLTIRKALAKVSQKPGKTQMINNFVINNKWDLVDLPGYGYARIAKSKKIRFSLLIEGYILQRENLNLLFLLIDSRHEPQRIDLNFIRFLAENGVPFVIIYTKCDKLSKTQLGVKLEAYKAVLSKEWDELPRIICTSSEKGMGRDEVLDLIDECIKKEITDNLEFKIK